MIGLVPRDHWEHNIGDLFRALARSRKPRENDERLFLDGIGECIPARSGRTALLAAIKALNLPPGARIGVPLYCCHVVFKAIAAAGCKPRFIDIEPETFCLSPEDLAAKRSQIEAVIAVHMFGNLCDMKKLKESAGGKAGREDTTGEACRAGGGGLGTTGRRAPRRTRAAVEGRARSPRCRGPRWRRPSSSASSARLSARAAPPSSFRRAPPSRRCRSGSAASRSPSASRCCSCPGRPDCSADRCYPGDTMPPVPRAHSTPGAGVPAPGDPGGRVASLQWNPA